MNYKLQKILSLFLIIIFSLLSGNSFAQTTKIIGKVTDSKTSEPIPFVNVFVDGTTIGTTTNFKGEYSLEIKNLKKFNLCASYVGYYRKLKTITPNKFQKIDFKLESRNITLQEVVIKYKGNPAEVILKKIIKNKEKNDKYNFQSYQYEVYNKIQFDANNISEKFKNKKVLKPFKFVFDNVDTSTVNGKSYLPVMLSETISDVFYRKSPKSKKEIIKASKISGIENESISQFAGEMYQDVNIYDNYMGLFQKNFVSPIANFGLTYYKYYLIDSSYIDNQWCYNIMFKPRRKQEFTFTGNFWVNDTSFAIKKYKIQIADDANINFINDIIIKAEYNKIDNKYMMKTKDYLVVDFNVIENTKKTIGLYGHRTRSYRNFVFNKPKNNKFYTTPQNIIVKNTALNKDKKYWQQARHDSLSKNEKAIYTMVDSVKSLPIFKTYVDVIIAITTGYYVKNNFEYGPYITTYSYNDIEGNRFRIGGRTSNKFSTKLKLDGHIAYGTKDNKFKYGAGLIYMLSRNPRHAIGASFKYDIEQLGQSQNAFREDNFLATLLRRNPADKLTMVREYKTYYEHEWFNGFSSTIKFLKRDIYPISDNFKIFNNNSIEEKKSITTSEIQFNTRFAYDEKYIMGKFERTNLGTKYPVFEIKYAIGLKGWFKGDYSYSRLQLGIHQWFNVGTLGWSKYIIEAGKISGKLPYPLLKLHEGNETFTFDEYSFNLMNYYEFVSDNYLSLFYTHHFDGLFLNKIPLMRKLKWREVAYIKGVIGSISNTNKNYSIVNNNTLNNYLNPLNKPYFETGVGIENIFRILRIDGIWRLSHLDNPNITKFGIFFTLQFSF